MEVDFNTSHKIMFSNRMMNHVRRFNLMPAEIFSEKGQTAVDGTLAKVLFYDLSRQFRKPAAIASVDTSNCFEQVCCNRKSSFQVDRNLPLGLTCHAWGHLRNAVLPPYGLWGFRPLLVVASNTRPRACAKGMGPLPQHGEWSAS